MEKFDETEPIKDKGEKKERLPLSDEEKTFIKRLAVLAATGVIALTAMYEATKDDKGDLGELPTGKYRLSVEVNGDEAGKDIFISSDGKTYKTGTFLMKQFQIPSGKDLEVFIENGTLKILKPLSKEDSK